MKIWSDSFKQSERIPEEFAFGKHNPDSHVELSTNRNPHLAWSDLPEGTKSLVLICHDTDVPSKPDDVNQEGKTVPATLPRVDFFHWVLVDIPADVDHIPAGEHSAAITPGGKSGPAAPGGTRHGISNYTDWFASDPDMSGDYFGYDGPCPPWNDEIIHNYHFTLYALDIEKCPVEGKFTGPNVLKAIEGRVLDKASITGTYAINPNAT
jgi:Raf kinase inhibitor-like YbhB/YbcL family protein